WQITPTANSGDRKRPESCGHSGPFVAFTPEIASFTPVAPASSDSCCANRELPATCASREKVRNSCKSWLAAWQQTLFTLVWGGGMSADKNKLPPLLAALTCLLSFSVSAMVVAESPERVVFVQAPGVRAAPNGQHGFPFIASTLNLAGSGFIEEEFFLS